MERKWTRDKAVKYLKSRKNIEITGPFIFAKDGFDGLTSCSASDFLVNYYGFRAIIIQKGRKLSQ